MDSLREWLLLFVYSYATMSFITFSFFFLMHHQWPEFNQLGKRYSMWDHFWLCLGLALTWPYGVSIFVGRGKGAD